MKFFYYMKNQWTNLKETTLQGFITKPKETFILIIEVLLLKYTHIPNCYF